MLKLEALKRDTKLDTSKLREEGKIPAVFYGPKEDATPITLSLSNFQSVYSQVGESGVIILKEGDNSHEVLIHDVQVDAVSGKPLHVDFYVIEKGKKLTVSVPLTFIGVSPAEKNFGGVLVKVMHELEIEASAKDLPQQIEVGLDSLVDFESQIKAKDLHLPEGVELAVDPEETIVLVQEPKEEEKEPEQEIDLDSIEVEKKGKEESEDTGDDSKEEKTD